MSSSSIGQSAGSVYVSIHGDNNPLARDLKQTDSLLHRHAAAMSGLQVFKPTLFTSQLAGIAAMARGSGVLYSQLHTMSTLAPKLGALVAPFQAMRTAMTGFRNVFDPGNIVRGAKAQSAAAIAEHDKMKKSLESKLGLTPDSAVKALSHYVAAVNKAKAATSGVRVNPLSQSLVLQSQIDAREKLAIAKSVYKSKDEAAALEPLKKELEQADKAVEKLTADLNKEKKATEALTSAQAKLAAASQSLRGTIGKDRLSIGDVNKQLAPHITAVEKAKENLKSAQGTSKLDIMGGGAVSAITNVISGVMSAGKIVWGVASSIFSVFKGIFNAVASVAHAIINALGEAFTFLKNLAVHTFQIVSVAVMAVGSALVAGLHSVFEKGKDLLNAYAQTGIRVKQALIIETAASMTGVDKENISTLVNRMQRAISGVDKEGPKIKDALRGLGLELGKLQGMSPVEQLTAISEGLGKISDPATRAGVATDIFSVRGAQMIAMLLQMTEGVRLARLQWGQAGDAFDKNKDKFAYIARSIEAITHVKIPSFFAGIATPLVNTLSWLSDKLNAFDPFKSGFKIGTKIDEYLRLIIGAFQKGRLMEWLGLELKVAFLEAVNYLIAGLMIAGDVLSSILHIEGLFPLIGHALAGAFKFAVGSFLQAFQGILPELGDGIGWLVDKLIVGVRYAGNMLLGGGIGGVVGAVGGGVAGGLIAGPVGIFPGAYLGATVLGATGVAAGAGLTDSNATTDYQDSWRVKAEGFNAPGRASGGPVKAGNLYTVGENGREYFVPDTNGYISPNLLPAPGRTPRASSSGEFPAVTGAGQPSSPLNDSAQEWQRYITGGPQPKAVRDLEQTPAQKLQADGLKELNDALKAMAKSVPDLMAQMTASVEKYLHPNKEAEAKKDALVKERDALVAQQEKLSEQIENPPTRDNANAMLASVKKQIASKQAQIDSGDLSPRAKEQAKYDLAKLQEQAAYQQAKVNEQKAYNQSTGADEVKRRKIKSLQRQINAKEKEIKEVQGTGPRDVMGVRADRDRRAALKKQLMAQGLVGSNGEPLDVSNQPPANKAGVAAGFAGTMSGWSAGRIGSFATGGTSKMEEHLKNIDHNTRGLTTGYGQ